METRNINGIAVNINSKKSNFGSGKKTVYSGNFTKDGQIVNFEDKAIDALNALCGIPRTTNSTRTIRVNSVDEIDTKSTLLINRVSTLLSKVDSLLKDYTDITVSLDVETLKEVKTSIKETMLKECMMEEQKKKEQEEKNALSALTQKIKAALSRGDFAEVARLSSEQAANVA